MTEHKNDSNPRQPGPGFAVPFFVALAVLTVVSFQIALRPTRSMMEKRDLATFPAFSVEALADGSYFDDITLWFSDTFPGRETWLQVADYSESLHGYSDIAIEGTLPQTDALPPLLEYVPPTQAPQEPSQEAAEPEPTQETTEAAQETQPQEWGGIDAGDAAEILQTATAIQIGDAVFQAQGFSQRMSDSYIKLLNDFTSYLGEKEITVVNAIPPTAVGILIEEEYLADLNCVSQKGVLDYLHSGITDQVVKVDTVTPLIHHNSEYLYFRTDHHWTALGAYYFYQATMEAIGLEPAALEDFELWPQGDFTGSLFGKAKRPQALRWDWVDAYIPQGDIVNTVYSKDGWPSEWPLLTDCSYRTTGEKYSVFGTDYPMTCAENRSLPDAPNVLLIKDSFGNCVVPFMTQNFHKVYTVDYRKYYMTPIVDLVDQYEIDYVIFMPNLTATQANQGPDMVRRVSLGWH